MSRKAVLQEIKESRQDETDSTLRIQNTVKFRGSRNAWRRNTIGTVKQARTDNLEQGENAQSVDRPYV